MQNSIADSDFVLRSKRLQMIGVEFCINGRMRVCLIPCNDIGVSMKLFEINKNSVEIKEQMHL